MNVKFNRSIYLAMFFLLTDIIISKAQDIAANAGCSVFR